MPSGPVSPGLTYGIATLFRSSFQSDFNLLANPFKATNSLFTLSFTSPEHSPSAAPPLLSEVRRNGSRAAVDALTLDEIDEDEATGIEMSMADLALVDDSLSLSSPPTTAAPTFYGAGASDPATSSIVHRQSALQGIYIPSAPSNILNGATSPTPTSASLNAIQQSSPPMQSPTLLGDLRGGGEHPFGEHPSRTLFVRNIHSSVDDEELRTLFSVTLLPSSVNFQ